MANKSRLTRWRLAALLLGMIGTLPLRAVEDAVTTEVGDGRAICIEGATAPICAALRERAAELERVDFRTPPPPAFNAAAASPRLDMLSVAVLSGLLLPWLGFLLLVLRDGLVAAMLLVGGIRSEGQVLSAYRRFGLLPRVRYMYWSNAGLKEGEARGRGSPGERISVRYAPGDPNLSRPSDILVWDVLSLLSFTALRLMALAGYLLLAVHQVLRPPAAGATDPRQQPMPTRQSVEE